MDVYLYVAEFHKKKKKKPAIVHVLVFLFTQPAIKIRIDIYILIYFEIGPDFDAELVKKSVAIDILRTVRTGCGNRRMETLTKQ